MANFAFFNGQAPSAIIAGNAETEAILRAIRAWSQIPGEVERVKRDVALKKASSANNMYTLGEKEFREYAIIPKELYFQIGIELEAMGDPDGRNWIAKPHLRDVFFSHFAISKLVHGGLQQTEG